LLTLFRMQLAKESGLTRFGVLILRRMLLGHPAARRMDNA
jgi:hypothetical protein